MSFTEAGGTITQTGTDADLSGLNEVTGVTRIHNGRHYVYHLTTNFYINGTLTIDPQTECLFMNNKRLRVNSGGTLNFGVTSVVGGATKYSRATGLISADTSYQQFLIMSGGTLNWNGGAMKLHGGADIQDGSTVNITNGIIVSTSLGSNRIRMKTAHCSVNGLSIDGKCRFDVFKEFVEFSNYSSSFTPHGAFQKIGDVGNHGGTDDPYVLTNFDATAITGPNGDFIGSSYSRAKIEFVNMAYDGDFNIAHDSGTGAVTTLYKDIKLKIVDTNLANIEGAKYWATDINNGSRFSGTASWRGAMNATESFLADRIYTGSTDSSGEATTRLLTRTCYGGTSPGGDYQGQTIIDHRSETTDNTDVFNFYVASYGHTLNSASPSCLGAGVLEQQVVLFADVFLTESDKTLVDAYTEIDTPQKFYDRAKSFLVDNYGGQAETLVSRAGIDIDAGSYDIEVDASASSAFAFDGSKITIKASAYSGNLTTSGTATLSNDAVVLGTITDSSGSSSTLQYSISELIQHSRVQIYNVTEDSEIFNGSVNATTYSAQYTEGTEVTTGDEIRLRVTRQSGSTAYLPFTATAIATASGFSFKASQLDDLVYNANGIDGGTITTLTADFPNVQVDVDDADGSCDVREIYARYVSIITTKEGISQWFGGITAINAVNYQVNTAVNDLTIQNVGTNGVNLGVARIFRDDGAIILAPGNAPITQDNGEFVQFIQPQINSAMNANSKLDGVSKNTSLIPSLL